MNFKELSLVELVIAVSPMIRNKRTLEQIALKTQEELGELSTEINIKSGFVNPKKGGADGILGESIDAILCLLDLIVVNNPEITAEEIMEVVYKKTQKWIAVSGNREKVEREIDTITIDKIIPNPVVDKNLIFTALRIPPTSFGEDNTGSGKQSFDTPRSIGVQKEWDDVASEVQKSWDKLVLNSDYTKPSYLKMMGSPDANTPPFPEEMDKLLVVSREDLSDPVPEPLSNFKIKVDDSPRPDRPH